MAISTMIGAARGNMDYLAQMEQAIDYIEDNLQNDIDLASCAKSCGYSQYHFLRLFKYVTGITPADYIRKRRISEIAKQIAENAAPISELAFRYGFNSKENFSRAFKKEHHILPSEYKLAKNSLKLYDKFSFKSSELFIAPEILTLEGFTLMVYQSDEMYAPNFWNQYNTKGYSRILSGGKTVCDYGVCIWNGETNRLDYYIGIKEDDAAGDLQGTRSLDIQGGLYARFATPPVKHCDFVNTINRTWDYIFRKWLPQSSYEFRGGYQFECYVESSRIYSEDIYIPIRER